MLPRYPRTSGCPATGRNRRPHPGWRPGSPDRGCAVAGTRGGLRIVPGRPPGRPRDARPPSRILGAVIRAQKDAGRGRSARNASTCAMAAAVLPATSGRTRSMSPRRRCTPIISGRQVLAMEPLDPLTHIGGGLEPLEQLRASRAQRLVGGIRGRPDQPGVVPRDDVRRPRREDVGQRAGSPVDPPRQRIQLPLPDVDDVPVVGEQRGERRGAVGVKRPQHAEARPVASARASPEVSTLSRLASPPAEQTVSRHSGPSPFAFNGP